MGYIKSFKDIFKDMFDALQENQIKLDVTKSYYSAAYDCDRCYKTIVFDCSLSNGSLVFVSLQKAIHDLEWQIGKGGCPSGK